jgi:hypothetical protein
MGKKEKLAKIHKTASGNCCDNTAILDSLISNAENCSTQCSTLLEMAKKKNIKVFKKIEKSRKILDITD